MGWVGPSQVGPMPQDGMDFCHGMGITPVTGWDQFDDAISALALLGLDWCHGVGWTFAMGWDGLWPWA